MANTQDNQEIVPVVATTGPDAGSTQQSESSQQSASASRKRKISSVWESFDIISVQGVDKAQCKTCKKLFSCASTGGTGHLNRHLKSHENKISSAQQLLNISGSSLSTFSYNMNTTKRGLAKLIVQSELPFSFAEKSNITEFLQTCFYPGYKPIGRRAIRSEIIKIFYEYKKTLINDLSSNTSSIALTSDVWTSHHNSTAYICVTAHWVDAKYNIQKRIIYFRIFSYPHTSHAIELSINSAIKEYNISNKIFSICFDNASNNDGAIGRLKITLSPILNGLFFHIRCACHVLNLCVQDGLKFIEPYIVKIRSIVKFIKGSGARIQEFKRLCSVYQISYKKFQLDVSVRWNSTYDMLVSVLPYRNILHIFCAEKLNMDDFPSDSEWDFISFLCTILEKFKSTTEKLSGVYYPTSHLILRLLAKITKIFKQYRENSNALCVEAIHAMEMKFKKYWGELPLIFCIAGVFDPRQNLSRVLACAQLFYDNLGIYFDLADYKWKIEKILHEMYSLYQNKLGLSTPVNISGQTSVQRSGQYGNDYSDDEEIEKIHSQTEYSTSSSDCNELMFYLRQPDMRAIWNPKMLENYTVLDWWRAEGNTFYILSNMARDILTVPMSTVASESCFSAGGRVLDEKRSRLNELSLEACVCLKDWLDAEKRMQNKDDDENDESDDESESSTPNE